MAKLHAPTLMECEESPVEFFKALGVYQIHSKSVSYDPYSHQCEIMNKAKTGKDLYVSKPRQVGMTASLAMYALWKAVFRPGTKILFMTYSSSQAPFDELYNSFARSKIPYINKIANLIVVQNQSQIEFSNGSTIYFGNSKGYGATLCGLAVNVAILDEFSWYKDQNDIYMSIIPMIIAGGGQLIIGGTPNDLSDSRLFQSKITTPSSPDYNTTRVIYSQNRYIRHSLHNRYPFTLGESGFFNGEESLKDLIYNNWFPLEELTESDYLHFY